MPTECSADLFGFAPVEGREVVAGFDGGPITSDAGALLLGATADPLHGNQEGRFFHGYYDCYCYLPLYVFCGRHLLAAKLRPASLDAAAGAVEEVARIAAQVRRRWPQVRILVRADSGFARDDLMAWCEANGVHFLFGLAQNERLNAMIAGELAQAEAKSRRTGKPARYFKEFRW